MSMAGNFNDLDTEKFRLKMRPFALAIYKRIWPGCNIKDLRTDGINVHVLDKEFGIDTISTFRSGQWVSIQEKYRRNAHLKYGDFTQEYKNADGTVHENPGEWFKLGAQLYFYGWANEKETSFEKWFIMDIPKYKLLIESLGGIEMVGKRHKNVKHGSASFYSVPLKTLWPAFITDYRKW